MAAGCAAKQIYWLLGISEEEFPIFPAVAVSTYNSLFNSINSLLFLSSSSTGNETLSSPPLLIGTGLYVTGILLELVSEIQRRNLKRDKRNTGKPYTE
ncbi:hypothetical protein MPER_16020, partial [Moniliophthora perniciosa FA553]